MTVYYMSSCQTSTVACFLKLLARWEGAIWKLLWKDLIAFLALFYAVNLSYRFAMSEEQKRMLERFAFYCGKYTSSIPLTALLGFYCATQIQRFFKMYHCVPWPHRDSILLATYLRGNDEYGLLVRRTVVRYFVLSFILTMRAVAPSVKKKYQTLEDLTKSGIVTEVEQKIIEDIKTPYNKYIIPLVWAVSLIMKARREGRITDDLGIVLIFKKIQHYRDQMMRLFLMDAVTVPLVYTQIVYLAIYMHCIFLLFKRQFLETTETIDIYVPVGLILEFLFYFGWLKLVEVILNPCGDDDDDYPIYSYTQRHYTFPFFYVDDFHRRQPTMSDLDYSLPVSKEKNVVDVGSADQVKISKEQGELITKSTFAHDRALQRRWSIHRRPSQSESSEEGRKKRMSFATVVDMMAPRFVPKRQRKSPFDNRFQEESVTHHEATVESSSSSDDSTNPIVHLFRRSTEFFRHKRRHNPKDHP